MREREREKKREKIISKKRTEIEYTAFAFFLIFWGDFSTT
jgi:hypothetical protein